MSTRRNDVRGEKALGLFLDKYFYPKLLDNNIITSFVREHNALEQKRGIDARIQINNSMITVDEKAQLYYIGRPLPSFIVEVNFYSPEADELIDGWFISSSNVTDTYLFIWINKASSNQLNRIISEDFEEVEIMFIKKESIQNYLLEEGFSKDVIRKKARRIREDGVDARTIKGKGFHFSFTKDRDELPINIVLEKKLIESLSDLHFMINKKDIIFVN